MQQYSDLLDLARRARRIGELADPLLPAVGIAWAKKLQISVPPELEAAVTKWLGLVDDWRATSNEENERFDVQSREFPSPSTISEILEERDRLREMVAELESALSDVSKSKGLSTRERRTLLS